MPTRIIPRIFDAEIADDSHFRGTLIEDLWFNDRSEFTRWLIGAGPLRESFVVVDVGVQGGPNPRWDLLGDYLICHGFDASGEAIAELKQADTGRAGLQLSICCSVAIPSRKPLARKVLRRCHVH